MTPSAQATKEAEELALAYQIALTKLGAQVIAEALRLWSAAPPSSGPQAASWLAQVAALIKKRRSEARAIGRAYYRLDRALRTGSTVADLSEPKTPVPMNQLRQEFRDVAGPQSIKLGSDNPTVEVERIPDLTETADRQDRDAELEVRTALAQLGPNNLAKKLDKVDTSKPALTVDAIREKAHAEAGARQASAAERITLNGARGYVWNATSKDTRAIGYVRLSRTGTPCGWCAMLISRGFVPKSGLYGSSKGAGGENPTDGNQYEDGDLYHDNCHCYAVPVYSRAELKNSPQFALNREYAELWPKVTKGLSGKAALAAWRRFIRTENRGAQAAPSTTAQEA